MIYESDLNRLLTKWKDMLEGTGNYNSLDSAYIDAVGDCYYDLKTLLDNCIEEQLVETEEEYFNGIIKDLPTDEEMQALMQLEVEQWYS